MLINFMFTFVDMVVFFVLLCVFAVLLNLLVLVIVLLFFCLFVIVLLMSFYFCCCVFAVVVLSICCFLFFFNLRLWLWSCWCDFGFGVAVYVLLLCFCWPNYHGTLNLDTRTTTSHVSVEIIQHLMDDTSSRVLYASFLFIALELKYVRGYENIHQSWQIMLCSALICLDPGLLCQYAFCTLSKMAAHAATTALPPRCTFPFHNCFWPWKRESLIRNLIRWCNFFGRLRREDVSRDPVRWILMASFITSSSGSALSGLGLFDVKGPWNQAMSRKWRLHSQLLLSYAD